MKCERANHVPVYFDLFHLDNRVNVPRAQRSQFSGQDGRLSRALPLMKLIHPNNDANVKASCKSDEERNTNRKPSKAEFDHAV